MPLARGAPLPGPSTMVTMSSIPSPPPRPLPWRRVLAPLAAAWLALVLLAAASSLPTWHALEYKAFDIFTALAAQGRVQRPTTILAIDEPSFQQLQQAWPFPRSLHARLIDRLRADGAAVIAMDVVFADPAADPAQDAALAQAIARAVDAGSRVVLASAQEHMDNANTSLWTEVLPLPSLLQAGAQHGNAGVQPDGDFVVRQQPQGADSLAAVVAVALGHAVPEEAANAGWVAYRGPRGTFDTRSYYQALEPGLLPPGFFRGKVVWVGRSSRTASELQHAQADMFNAPFATLGGERLFPGVELQATLLDNILSDDSLHTVPGGWTGAWVLLALAILVPASLRWHPGAVAGLAGALVLGTVLVSWVLFVRARLWWPPLWPMSAVLAMYGATALTGYAAARRRARQVHAMFSQYVPPEVVARLVERPELLRLGGELREVTLLFTDLANFTTLSEQLSAEHTVEVLTGYFNAMTPIVHASGGTVDKFIGDAVMAFWGAPLPDAQHAEHAVRAAIAMQQAMEPLVAGLRARGLPGIHMRIGIHTGSVVVGNVGSEQRFAYTAIGDAVNLAARLEGANKAFGTDILLSGATAAQLPAGMALRPLDDVIVKGKTEPVRVYTPCADAEVCRLSQAALAALHARDADGASAALQALLARLPGDPAAQRLAARLAAACALPPGAPWPVAVALDKL